MENLISIALNSVFVGNILLAYFLGMCSFLAVSKSMQTATGLGFAVDLNKPDFLGKAYCVEKKAQGPAFRRRLVQVLVKDPEPLLYHAEVIHRNNQAVGYVRAASYGFTLGGAVGLAMIEADEPINKAYLQEGEWEIDIAGERFPLQVSLASRAMYDPKMEKVRA